MEFVSFIDTRKGKKLLKVFKSQRAANMFLKKNTDKILSKRDIESVGTMSKKEWDTKEAKYAIEGFKSDAQRKAAFANGYEEKDKKNEGKKRFKRQDGIGKAKYTISYHDGKKKHKDGSDFFDIKIFKNKKDLSDFVGTLAKQGYKLTNESVVNEDKVSNGTVSTLEKGIQRILGTKVNHDINRNGAHEFYIDDAEFVIGVNDGTEKKVAYSFSIYDDGARKYLGKGTSADEKDLIKQVLSIVKKYKKQLLLTTESVNEGKVDSILKRLKSAYDKSKNKKLDIKKLKDQLKTYKKLGASDKKDQIKAGEMFLKSIRESVNEGKFKVDDLVYNKRTKTVGIVRIGDDKYGEVKTDADGNVDVDELEKYNPIKFKHQSKAKAAPSTQKEVSKRGLFNPFKNESVNESASKEAMGIAALTGTRGSAVQDFIDKNRINSRKLFNALKKANLQGRINFASALAGKPNNPNAKLTIKLFGESKKEVITFRKKAKSETAFYDILDKIERKYGRGVFEKWLDKSLKDLKLNPKKYKTSADKQEALYQAKL